jgi:methionine aminopeptidase
MPISAKAEIGCGLCAAGRRTAAKAQLVMKVQGTRQLSDGWTAVTRDRPPSAQYEQTVAVTETGIEIFMLSPKGLDRPRLPTGRCS